MKKIISIMLVIFLILTIGTPVLAKPSITKTVETGISLFSLWLEGDINDPDSGVLLNITNYDQMTGQTKENLTVTINKIVRLADPPEGENPYSIMSFETEIPESWLTIKQKPEVMAALNRDLAMSMVEVDQMGEPIGEPVTVSVHITLRFEAIVSDISSSSTQTQIGNNMYMVKTENIYCTGTTSFDFTYDSITEHYTAKPYDPSNMFFSDTLSISKRTTQEIIH